MYGYIAMLFCHFKKGFVYLVGQSPSNGKSTLIGMNLQLQKQILLFKS